MFRRMTLFFMVNILIITTLFVVTSALGLGNYVTAQGLDYKSLAIFCLVWGMGGAFLSLWISRWVAKKMMGVKVIRPGEGGSTDRDLVAKVHALSKKAGMTVMPEVGIYESQEVNAFATGPTRKRSLVAVSRGLLSRMKDDQVEAILAHEVSHIVNGDMVTMTLLQGVINAVVMFLARVIAFAITSRMRDGGRVMVHFMIVIVLQIVFSLLGMIVVTWFSRLREFKADAGGARLAGRKKMVSALEGLRGTLNLASVGEEPASLKTLKISSRPAGFSALLSTHPPLEKRIQALQSLDLS